MKMNKTDALFSLMVLAPLENIIKKLEKWEYVDNDIPFLESKLLSYTKICMQVIGKKGIVIADNEKTYIMNEYMRDRYLLYFNTILNLFKTAK